MGIVDTGVGLLLFTVIALLLSSVQFFAHIVTHPNCCTEDLPSRTTNRAWEAYKTPADAKVPFTAVTFPAQDGGNIEGWVVPKTTVNVTKYVVLVHDSGADKRQMIELAGQINERIGWGCVLFNTRETEVSSFGRAAVVDVLSALTYVRTLPNIDKVAVLGVTVGAGAGMYAAIKDTSVDAFISVSMPTTAHQFWQHGLGQAMEELQHSVPAREAKNQTVSLQAKLAKTVVDLVYTRQKGKVQEKSSEDANFMAKMSQISQGWFVDMAAHLTVMYGAGYRAWLQEIADPHKAIHRLQPRSFYLVHGKLAKVTPMWLAQNLYNRAGSCAPKLALIQMEAGDDLDLRADNSFYAKLMTLM